MPASYPLNELGIAQNDDSVCPDGTWIFKSRVPFCNNQIFTIERSRY